VSGDLVMLFQRVDDPPRNSPQPMNVPGLFECVEILKFGNGAFELIVSP
jgi:hypothetical protein